MNKAKLTLALILLFAAAGAAMATKARSFIGYINVSGSVYAPVYVPFNCPDIGWGCIYTSTNGLTYQVYTLSGIRLNPVKP